MEIQNKTDQSQINRVVWKACDTFRGVIDPSQYKDYILTMLFLKYVSDVYKSKYAEYLKRYEGDKERAAPCATNASLFPKQAHSIICMTTVLPIISAS
jgi:type I restriction enzyme M protein